MIWKRSRAEDKTTFMLLTPFFWGGRGLLPRQRPLLSSHPLLLLPRTYLTRLESFPRSPFAPLFPRFTLLLCSFHLSLLLLAPPPRVMCSQSPSTPTLSHLPSSPLYFRSHVRSCHVNTSPPPPLCPSCLSIFSFFLPPFTF